VCETVSYAGRNLQASEVGRSRPFRGLLDVELDVLTLFEVRAANVFHVEEDVVVSIVSVDKAVTASVVEEVNRTVCHCNYTEQWNGDKGCELGFPL